MRRTLVAAFCLLAGIPPLQAQGPCPGGGFGASVPEARALAKFTPAAAAGGVTVHGWLDTGRTPPEGHLVVQNANPYPVAVRFRVELRGSGGTLDAGERCVMVHARQFVLDRDRNTVFAYAPGTLWSVRVGGVRVSALSPPEEDRPAPAPPAAAAPRPAPDTAAASAAPPAPLPPTADTVRAPERDTVTATVPAAGPDTVPAAAAPDSLPRTVAVAPAPVRPAPRTSRRLADADRPSRERPGPGMHLVGEVLRLVFGAGLTLAGAALGVAVLAALYLLIGVGAAHLFGSLRPRRGGGG